jgi:hypothetical protein
MDQRRVPTQRLGVLCLGTRPNSSIWLAPIRPDASSSSARLGIGLVGEHPPGRIGEDEQGPYFASLTTKTASSRIPAIGPPFGFRCCSYTRVGRDSVLEVSRRGRSTRAGSSSGSTCRAACGSRVGSRPSGRRVRGRWITGGRHEGPTSALPGQCAAQAQRRRGVTRRATRVPASRPSPGREMNRRPAPVSPANRIRSLRLCQWISSKDLRSAGVQRFGGATPRTAGCGPQAKKDLVVQDPHLRSSAPLEPPGKSDRAWGNSLNVAHNVDSPPRTRVAVEAQLRDETSFYRQDREISFQVPGSFSEELSEYAGPVTLRGRGRC